MRRLGVKNAENFWAWEVLAPLIDKRGRGKFGLRQIYFRSKFQFYQILVSKVNPQLLVVLVRDMLRGQNVEQDKDCKLRFIYIVIRVQSARILLQTELLKFLNLLLQTSSLALGIAKTLLLSGTNLRLDLILPVRAAHDAL